MDASSAHIITLWCAVLGKAEKGMDRLLPQGTSLLQFRLMEMLDFSKTSFLSEKRIARALVVRPSDIEAALFALMESGYVFQDDSEGNEAYLLTSKGIEHLRQLQRLIDEFIEHAISQLDAEARQTISEMVFKALTKPGSFYAEAPPTFSSDGQMPTFYYITAVDMMYKALTIAIRRCCDLSFTDFRFMLELYPKRAGITKTLRARKCADYLDVGRAYITSASYRLESAGFIERIPDPDDARGISFLLTLLGEKVVRDTGDNIYAAYVSLFGDDRELQHRALKAMRSLLEGTENALGK